LSSCHDGKYRMGEAAGQEVTVGRRFTAKYKVTQDAVGEGHGENPSKHAGDTHPVVR